MTSITGKHRLRIVSYNIQAAIGAMAPGHYVTRLHRQFLHVKAKDRLLRRIGGIIEPFDIACIQEVDLGGRRSNFESQVDGLFEATTFTEAAYQENRIVRRISRHGNLILTRRELADANDIKLPARMGGRGALVGRYPVVSGHMLTVVNLHLSLGSNDRIPQLEVLAEALSDHQPLTARLMQRLAREARDAGGQLVTTEKDATRLPPEWRSRVLTLPVRLAFADPDRIDALLRRLFDQSSSD